MRIDLVTVLVHDYDEAIAFYTDVLGFELAEDSASLTDDGRPKRWVVVRPSGAATGILLAEADDDRQAGGVGDQFAGRVGMFLHVDDFATSYERMRRLGVEFMEEPRHESTAPWPCSRTWRAICGICSVRPPSPAGTLANRVTVMGIDVIPSGQACGATVRGIDLHDLAQRNLDDATVSEIRTAWLEHKVLAFPDQDLSDTDLEAFTLRFGPFGDDPFFAAIDGHPHVAAIRRTANETSSLFAENWHADWSFQEFPPDGTCLYAKTIPTVGGDTLFSNQQAALDAMPTELRERIDGRVAIHSARGGYAPDGTYGDGDDSDRSMQIRPSDDAYATQLHPLVRIHPETGAETLYSVLGYIIGIDGMDDEPDDIDAARSLLGDLYHWQTRDEFQYRHRWEPAMLVMWDNRCVLHRATGGYEGHERLLHRTTIGYNADVRAS